MSSAGVLRGRWPEIAWTLVLALAITGPLWLGRGFWLVGDMVFVPHQPWKDAWLGLDGTLPRAVPMDALISLVGHVLPGEVLQRLLLTGGFLLGGLGIGRLTERLGSVSARLAAITLFCWNPWVHERLGIGQWAILLGYLLLPWVAVAARRLRADPRDLGPAVVALVLSAVCSPSSGVMALLALLVLGATRRSWWRVLALSVGANLAWLVPSVTATTAHVSTTGVFAGFAARGESAVGVVPSLLSLGGIWKTSVVPEARTVPVVVLFSCLLSLAAVAGLRRWSTTDRDETVRMVVLGAVALLAALLPAIPGGDGLLEAVGAHVPGVALLRDSHRFLAPFGLLLAFGAAGATAAVRASVRTGLEALWGVVGLLVVAPVLLLPGLGWGLGGHLQRSSYPESWDSAAHLVEQHPGTTVVLPWAGSYRAFEWDHRRAVLDPAPRFFPGEVLVDDRTYLTDRVVPAEDPRSEAVRQALTDRDPVRALRVLRVRWVLVEPGGTPPGGATPVASVHRWPGLSLLDLGPVPAGDSAMPTPVTHRWWVLAGLAETVFLLSSGFLLIIRCRSNGDHISGVWGAVPVLGRGPGHECSHRCARRSARIVRAVGRRCPRGEG